MSPSWHSPPREHAVAALATFGRGDPDTVTALPRHSATISSADAFLGLTRMAPDDASSQRTTNKVAAY